MVREHTRPVKAGAVSIGGGAPITIQSMTNTDTRDVDKTVAQIERLAAAGCEIVRSSVYDMDSASALKEIKRRIRIPLVADIHFDYRLAIAAIEAGMDKLRFNPGNIGSGENVLKLAAAAKDYGVPIRVGVNGGSLEAELLRRYGGPTPEAMVESALKHALLLEQAGFYDIVLSIKSSVVPDMVAACRLAAKKAPYPLHIGVTEAGMGPLAVAKSAVGIGALLLDGIGDTLRVSLTGDPVQEVEAALVILQAAGLRKAGVEIVSCPTCGRCNVDLADIVALVRGALPEEMGARPVKLAVMGCAVNGPGEAREADAGLACGREGRAVAFYKGEQVGGMPLMEAVHWLSKAAEKLSKMPAD